MRNTKKEAFFPYAAKTICYFEVSLRKVISGKCTSNLVIINSLDFHDAYLLTLEYIDTK